MDIIAIKGVRTESLRRFWKDWWPVQGFIMKQRGWLFLFITGTEYFGTIGQYAELISVVMEKLVIYIRGKSGVVEDFTIYERGIACPTSKVAGKHESWLIENRLSLWGMSEQDQENINKLLTEFNGDTSGPISYLDLSNTRLTRLAVAMFTAWKLPTVWSANDVDKLPDLNAIAKSSEQAR
jgi:hypothetical protein